MRLHQNTATKWQCEIDRVAYEYNLDLLTLEEAIGELRKFGFDRYEANEYLYNSVLS